MIPILVKRPVAFRIPRADSATAGETLSQTDWRYFTDEGEANAEAEAMGVDYQALFVRDGSAITAEWSPIEYARKNPEATLLVCEIGDLRGPFIVRADILWQARKAGTPSHLGLSRLTHWMPLPAGPALSYGKNRFPRRHHGPCQRCDRSDYLPWATEHGVRYCGHCWEADALAYAAQRRAVSLTNGARPWVINR